MTSPEQPKFEAYSEELNRTFPDFIISALRSHQIGPDNASRLLRAWPGDAQPSPAQSQLADLIATPATDEIIATPLRKISDFNEDDDVRLRLPDDGHHWTDGIVDDLTNNQVVVSVSKHVSIMVPPFYPALFRTSEYDRLDKDKPGSGKGSTHARYVIKLGFFDRRLIGYEELINHTARKFGAASEKNSGHFRY